MLYSKKNSYYSAGNLYKVSCFSFTYLKKGGCTWQVYGTP
jgi:hypothetical protein